MSAENLQGQFHSDTGDATVPVQLSLADRAIGVVFRAAGDFVKGAVTEALKQRNYLHNGTSAGSEDGTRQSVVTLNGSAVISNGATTFVDLERFAASIGTDHPFTAQRTATTPAESDRPTTAANNTSVLNRLSRWAVGQRQQEVAAWRAISTKKVIKAGGQQVKVGLFGQIPGNMQEKLTQRAQHAVIGRIRR